MNRIVKKTELLEYSLKLNKLDNSKILFLSNSLGIEIGLYSNNKTDDKFKIINEIIKKLKYKF